MLARDRNRAAHEGRPQQADHGQAEVDDEDLQQQRRIAGELDVGAERRPYPAMRRHDGNDQEQAPDEGEPHGREHRHHRPLEPCVELGQIADDVVEVEVLLDCLKHGARALRSSAPAADAPVLHRALHRQDGVGRVPSAEDTRHGPLSSSTAADARRTTSRRRPRTGCSATHPETSRRWCRAPATT